MLSCFHGGSGLLDDAELSGRAGFTDGAGVSIGTGFLVHVVFPVELGFQVVMDWWTLAIRK